MLVRADKNYGPNILDDILYTSPSACVFVVKSYLSPLGG